MSNPSRVQKGVPTGGQFAAQQLAESDIELSADPPAGGFSEDEAVNRLVADGLTEDAARQAVAISGMMGLAQHSEDGTYRFDAEQLSRLRTAAVPQHPAAPIPPVVSTERNGDSTIRVGDMPMGHAYKMADGTYGCSGPMGTIHGFAEQNAALTTQCIALEDGRVSVPVWTVDTSRLTDTDQVDYINRMIAEHDTGTFDVASRPRYSDFPDDPEKDITVNGKKFGGAYKTADGQFTSFGPLGMKSGFATLDAAVEAQASALRSGHVVALLPDVDTAKLDEGRFDHNLLAQKIQSMRQARPKES